VSRRHREDVVQSRDRCIAKANGGEIDAPWPMGMITDRAGIQSRCSTVVAVRRSGRRAQCDKALYSRAMSDCLEGCRISSASPDRDHVRLEHAASRHRAR